MSPRSFFTKISSSTSSLQTWSIMTNGRKSWSVPCCDPHTPHCEHPVGGSWYLCHMLMAIRKELSILPQGKKKKKTKNMDIQKIAISMASTKGSVQNVYFLPLFPPKLLHTFLDEGKFRESNFLFSFLYVAQLRYIMWILSTQGLTTNTWQPQ